MHHTLVLAFGRESCLAKFNIAGVQCQGDAMKLLRRVAISTVIAAAVFFLRPRRAGEGPDSASET
jgi:hypothetical protein